MNLALLVGESSLRASPALIAALALRHVLAVRTSATSRRACLLVILLAVPALPGVGVLLPDLTLSLPGSVSVPRAGGAENSTVLPTLIRLVAALWFLGVVLMLARLMVGLARVHLGARAAETLHDPEWLADLDGMAATLGLTRVPELRLSRLECMPHAWGYVRPLVVLPRSAVDWPATRRRAVLAHEIGHLARREPVARVAVEVVRAIHWFDPLLRLTVAGFRRESELAADEAALGLGVNPGEYAEHLVALARERRVAATHRAVPGFAAPGELERRVERVLGSALNGARPYGEPGLLRLILPILALVLMALMAVPRLGPSGSPLERWSERYGIPPELAGEILTIAEREGIDPGVAFGLVAEESGFDAGVISARGAVGLTQILPSTARLVQPGTSPDELREVSVNLRVGFRYLRAQIEREGGNVVNGLAAYALGPGRMDEIRGRGEPVPIDYPARVLAHLD